MNKYFLRVSVSTVYLDLELAFCSTSSKSSVWSVSANQCLEGKKKQQKKIKLWVAWGQRYACIIQQNFLQYSHFWTAEFPHSLHGFLEQRLQRALAESILSWPEIFIIIMTFAEVFLNVLGELLDDDIGVFTKRVVVLETLSYLANSLKMRKRYKVSDLSFISILPDVSSSPPGP